MLCFQLNWMFDLMLLIHFVSAKQWRVVKNSSISFFEGNFGYQKGPFQIFSAMAHGIPSMIHQWFMDFHTLPMSWMAGHGRIMDGGPWRDNLGIVLKWRMATEAHLDVGCHPACHIPPPPDKFDDVGYLVKAPCITVYSVVFGCCRILRFSFSSLSLCLRLAFRL